MSDRDRSETEQGLRGGKLPRQPYESPELVRYGAMLELTSGGTMGSSEGKKSNAQNKMS